MITGCLFCSYALRLDCLPLGSVLCFRFTGISFFGPTHPALGHFFFFQTFSTEKSVRQVPDRGRGDRPWLPFRLDFLLT